MAVLLRRLQREGRDDIEAKAGVSLDLLFDWACGAGLGVEFEHEGGFGCIAHYFGFLLCIATAAQ